MFIFYSRKCALTETVRICQYRAIGTETGEWHYLCQSARQRVNNAFYYNLLYLQLWLVNYPAKSLVVKFLIIWLQIVAVCDFFTYIRYIHLGLVKKDGKTKMSHSQSSRHIDLKIVEFFWISPIWRHLSVVNCVDTTEAYI